MYEDCKVYGPYKRADGRKHVILYKDGKRTTLSYPKYLMEVQLGRKLSRYEQVHHKDENLLNNTLENLKLTQLGIHQSDHAKLPNAVTLLCVKCAKPLLLTKEQYHDLQGNLKKGSSGPYHSLCRKSNQYA